VSEKKFLPTLFSRRVGEECELDVSHLLRRLLTDERGETVVGNQWY